MVTPVDHCRKVLLSRWLQKLHFLHSNYSRRVSSSPGEVRFSERSPLWKWSDVALYETACSQHQVVSTWKWNDADWKTYSSVLLHCFRQVIGLHRNGYGRLLAECMFTAKILYCLWVTLANEDDNFVLVTTKPLPKFKEWSEEQQIKFIRERILGKTNEELVKVS